MIVSDLIRAYTDELEYLEQSLSVMSECNGTVMRVIALDQYVTIETSHLGNSENTDTAEGSGRNGKDFTLCNVSAQLAVCSRL